PISLLHYGGRFSGQVDHERRPASEDAIYRIDLHYGDYLLDTRVAIAAHGSLSDLALTLVALVGRAYAHGPMHLLDVLDVSVLSTGGRMPAEADAVIEAAGISVLWDTMRNQAQRLAVGVGFSA